MRMELLDSVGHWLILIMRFSMVTFASWVLVMVVLLLVCGMYRRISPVTVSLSGKCKRICPVGF